MYCESQDKNGNAQSPYRRKRGFEDGTGKPKYQVPEREPLKTFVSFKCPGGAITSKKEIIFLVVLFLFFFNQVSINPKPTLTEVIKHILFSTNSQEKEVKVL